MDLETFTVRCPYCGCALRNVYGHWWCDWCKIYPYEPLQQAGLRGFLKRIDLSVRRMVQRIGSTGSRSREGTRWVEAGPVYRSPNQPTLHASSPTPSVAASTHQASQTQTYAPSAPAQIKTRKEPPKVKIITLDLDEAVYDYIVSREGEISLAKAAKDLNISVEELKSSIERLRTSGKLKSEHPPQATPSTSKYCRKCGAEMPKEAKYCPECGAKKNDQPGS